MMRTRGIRAVAAALAIVLTSAVSGCASLSPTKLPSAQTFRSGWTMKVDFATVVNLPDQSKVTINGIDGGVVKSSKIVGKNAEVTLLINDDMTVSADATAEIRQDTLLGDTYVSLTNPSMGTANALRHGGVLPVANTKQPVQIESLLSSLANFVNAGSGGVGDLGETFRRVNAQFPQNPADVRRIEGTMMDTLNAWADNTDQLNQLLNSANGAVQTLADSTDVTNKILSPDGPQIMKAFLGSFPMFQMWARASALTNADIGLVPLLNSLTGVINGVVKPILIPGWPNGKVALATQLQSLLTDKLIPFFQNSPKLNVRQLAIDNNVPTATQADLMVRTFRMMGLVQ